MATTKIKPEMLDSTTLTYFDDRHSPLSGFRNKLINGDFEIWQRGLSYTSTVGGYDYTADRALVFGGTSAVFTASQQAFAAGAQEAIPGRPEFFFRHERTTASTAGGYIYAQKVENVRRLAATQLTLTYWGRVASGTLSITPRFVQDFGSGGSAYVAIDATPHTLTTTWQKFTALVTVPSEAGKTIGVGNHLGLYLLSPTDVTFTAELAHMSLVEGDATAEANPFSPRSAPIEKLLCDWFFRRIVVGLVMTHVPYSYGNSRWTGASVEYAMRTVPSVAYGSYIQSSSNLPADSWYLGLVDVTDKGATAVIGKTATGTGSPASAYVYASREITLDAEL